MDSEQKRALSSIAKEEYFQQALKKLILNVNLDDKEKSYILSTAILFSKIYEQDQRFCSYIELAYFIILKYSNNYQDFRPLYDFSINFGFFPISRFIHKRNLLSDYSIFDAIANSKINKFENNGYVETYEQNTIRNKLLGSNENENAFIAPTSFGKSSVIIEIIRKFDSNELKVGIIVPTKSLLMQTYRLIRDSNLSKRILIHDEMYKNEATFIAVFTQERALRLLEKNEISFNLLFIDEAHNLLEKSDRSVLLSRLINKCNNRVLNLKIYYLSPFIDDANSLKHKPSQSISQLKIKFTVKEPEIYEYKNNKEVIIYNRFLNESYLIGSSSSWLEYIIENAGNKNFIYLRRPIHIEEFAISFSKNHEDINDPKIDELVNVLKKYVHQDFYVIDLLKKGILYIHGKLPDLIKEFLEEQFIIIDNIKYIIANTVILEGVNLPIDTLFVLNTYSLDGKGLTNLIGRVNRLNQIFNLADGNLNKLFPKVHFVNNELYNGQKSDMYNKITKLRSRVFKDVPKNPLLCNFDIKNLKPTKDRLQTVKNEVENTIQNEKYLNEIGNNNQKSLKWYLIEKGIDVHYDDVNLLSIELTNRMNGLNAFQPPWVDLDMFNKIYVLFVKDIKGIKDYEILRLQNEDARKFYKKHIFNMHRYNLHENIELTYQYFKQRSNDEDPLYYIGSSYGELAKQTSKYPDSENKVYIVLLCWNN